MVALGENGFEAVGLSCQHWKDGAAVRRIFREAFARAGRPYVNPHSFRNTLVALGERLCGPPEEFKAWSQNLGHEHVLTTFTSYGTVGSHRQAEIFDELRKRAEDAVADGGALPAPDAIAKAVALLTGKAA
jgi:integrase